MSDSIEYFMFPLSFNTSVITNNICVKSLDIIDYETIKVYNYEFDCIDFVNVDIRTKLRHGQCIGFDIITQIKCYSCYYYNGILHGEYIQYYPTGIPRIIANYDMGNLDGIMKTFHRNGKIKQIGIFKKNVYIETKQLWDAFGNLIVQNITHDIQYVSNLFKIYINSLDDRNLLT